MPQRSGGKPRKAVVLVLCKSDQRAQRLAPSALHISPTHFEQICHRIGFTVCLKSNQQKNRCFFCRKSEENPYTPGRVERIFEEPPTTPEGCQEGQSRWLREGLAEQRFGEVGPKDAKPSSDHRFWSKNHTFWMILVYFSSDQTGFFSGTWYTFDPSDALSRWSFELFFSMAPCFCSSFELKSVL